ncbi:MAG: hypothetical protein NVSMB52_20810 [Chloroflexota bacterium]
MKKSIAIAALTVTGVFGAGYTIGQIGGVTGSSAASAIVTATTTQTTPDAGHDGGGGMDAPHADGTVTAINGETLTISAGTDPSSTTEYTGVTTVKLTSTTQYDAGHDSTATANKSSIKVGSYVIVDGTLSSDGKSITASSLRINAEGPIPGR